MTFGHLQALKRGGTAIGATIRQVTAGYVIELDIGPTRWILISTRGKRPRRFQHLDGAANAMRRLGAQPVHLALCTDTASAGSGSPIIERN